MEQTVREFVRTHPVPAFFVGFLVILAASIKGSGVLLAMAIIAAALAALTIWRPPVREAPEAREADRTANDTSE